MNKVLLILSITLLKVYEGEACGSQQECLDASGNTKCCFRSECGQEITKERIQAMAKSLKSLDPSLSGSLETAANPVSGPLLNQNTCQVYTDGLEKLYEFLQKIMDTTGKDYEDLVNSPSADDVAEFFNGETKDPRLLLASAT